MASEAALNDVGVPRGVVKARTAIGTLHTTIASVELATHAKGKTVGRIGTKKVTGSHRDHIFNGVIASLVVEPALDLRQVGNKRMVVLHVIAVHLW